MLHRQLDRIHAFFQRPGITPGRVAPWLALALLGLALLIGFNLGPLDQQRASYDDGTIVVAGGGGQAQTPAPAGAVAGVSASSADSGASGTSPDSGSGGETSSPSADAGSGAPLPEPTPEPPYTDPQPATSPPETTADDQPTAEPTESYEGTVVSADKASSSYALATPEQDLVAVHADKLPKAGDSVRIDVKSLTNGTFAEAGDREKLDTATSAQFRGWVTWAAADGLSYVLSNRGVSLLVARPEGGDPLPLGAPVLVAADLDSGGLTQTSLATEGERTDAPVHVAGVVGAIDTQARTLTLTPAPDAELPVAVPDSIDLSKLSAGDVIDATVVIGADGSYTLTGVSANADTDAADDPGLAQGDQVDAEDPAATGKWADMLLRSLGIAPVR